MYYYYRLLLCIEKAILRLFFANMRTSEIRINVLIRHKLQSKCVILQSERD